jgi:hypothetical protein
MDANEFSELCREPSPLLNVENIEALSETGTFVEVEKVGVVFGEDVFDGVHVYVDVGRLEDPQTSEGVLRDLLEMNLELSASEGESFGLHSEAGSLVLRSFFRNEEASVQELADGILRQENDRGRAPPPSNAQRPGFNGQTRLLSSRQGSVYRRSCT